MMTHPIHSSVLIVTSTVCALIMLLTALLMPSTAHANPTDKSAVTMFKDSTYNELQAYKPSDRVIAIVRCQNVAVIGRGSRSERQEMETLVVAGPETVLPGSRLNLSTYAQGAALMQAGKTYLIAAYVEFTAGPLALVEIIPTDNLPPDYWETVQNNVQKRLAP